ncbi:15274_t:CDS:2, partial [Cetraspora pellucida]
MRLLIRKFTPFHKQTADAYAKLLFGPIGLSQSTNNKNPNELNIEDKFDTQIISEQLCQLLQKTPEEIGLVALFLDSRIKHLKFLIELDKSPTMSTLKLTTTNNSIAALYSNKEPNNKILNETE